MTSQQDLQANGVNDMVLMRAQGEQPRGDDAALSEPDEPALKDRLRLNNLPLITRPVDGAVYTVRWKEGNRMLPWAAVSLPPGDIGQYLRVLGLSPTHLQDPVMQDSLAHRPECYTGEFCGDDAGTSRLCWAPGYEDNGPREHHRWFLVRYFDRDGSYGWVQTADLVYFDPDDKAVHGVQEAMDYLRRRSKAERETAEQLSKRGQKRARSPQQEFHPTSNQASCA